MPATCWGAPRWTRRRARSCRGGGSALRRSGRRRRRPTTASCLSGSAWTPKRIQFDDIARLPVTSKEDLREHGEAFVRRGARPAYRSTTTGTTGWPTTVWFSDYENHLIGALSAISFLGQKIIEPDDFVLVSISTRARLGVHGVTFSANAIGAVVHPAGVVSPEHTLALLSERHRIPGKKPQVSVMSTYPSYLGELLECGRELGYGPSDFGLERVLLGGEILSEGHAAAGAGALRAG